MSIPKVDFFYKNRGEMCCVVNKTHYYLNYSGRLHVRAGPGTVMKQKKKELKDELDNNTKNRKSLVSQANLLQNDFYNIVVFLTLFVI